MGEIPDGYEIVKFKDLKNGSVFYAIPASNGYFHPERKYFKVRLNPGACCVDMYGRTIGGVTDESDCSYVQKIGGERLEKFLMNEVSP